MTKLHYQKSVLHTILAHENPSYKSVAMLWKNGIPDSISDGTKSEIANCIFVSGNNVYISGKEMARNGNYIVKYWKNGVAIILSDSSSKNIANSISISDNNIYVRNDRRHGSGIVRRILLKSKNNLVVYF